MKYRKLGGTGLEVSEIGFGAWGIGGLSHGATSYGPTDDEESKLALLTAFESGITLYDTSDLYGYGHSEQLIGETLGAVRSKIVIASKVGFLEHEGPQDFSSRHLRKSIELSLKRLQTDYLDIYQLHSPPVAQLIEDPGIMATLDSLRQEGKILVAGISVRSPDEGLTAVEELGFKSVQVNFNLVDQRAWENGLFDIAMKENAGVIIRTPLAFGFLTGKSPSDSELDKRDHRSTWSAAQRERWSQAPEIFSSLIGGETKASLQAALRFCLSFEAVSSVIPGMLKKSEVIENVQASGLKPFTGEELQKIREVYQSTTFFLGPKREKER